MSSNLFNIFILSESTEVNSYKMHTLVHMNLFQF